MSTAGRTVTSATGDRRAHVTVPDASDRRPVRTLWKAASIHADRFGHRRLVSLLTLASADHRIVVPQGVATVTRVPSRRGLAAWVVSTVALIGFLAAAGWAADRWVTVVMLAVLVGTTVVIGVLALDRRFRARSLWPSEVGAWQLTDVAAVRGAGAGERIMDEVERRADAVAKPVVLTVQASGGRAVELYAGHGFEAHPATGDRVRMRRPSTRAGAGTGGRTWAVAMGVAWAAVVVALAWPSPVGWLVPPAATLLTVAAIVDVDRKRIPNWLTGLGFAGLLVGAGLLQLETGFDLVGSALVGALVVAGPLLLTHVLTAARTPGLGDVKLAASAGLVCGAFDVRLALPALIATCLIGGAWGTIWQGRTGQRSFPLAPAIALGTAVVLAIGAFLDWRPM